MIFKIGQSISQLCIDLVKNHNNNSIDNRRYGSRHKFQCTSFIRPNLMKHNSQLNHRCNHRYQNTNHNRINRQCNQIPDQSTVIREISFFRIINWRSSLHSFILSSGYFFFFKIKLTPFDSVQFLFSFPKFVEYCAPDNHWGCVNYSWDWVKPSSFAINKLENKNWCANNSWDYEG